jgi:trimeric autotransporter adhesin
MLDLTGDGVNTTSVLTDGVDFDISDTGSKTRVSWLGEGTGFLALDLNQDGLINGGQELFGSATALNAGGRATNGFEALAQYDDNHDNVINELDAVFSDLRVWVDGNHDGVTNQGELLTMAQADVAEIRLDYLLGSELDNGNLMGMVSEYLTQSGETKAVVDVWLQTQKSVVQGPVQLEASTVSAVGDGSIADLSIMGDLNAGAQNASRTVVEQNGVWSIQDSPLFAYDMSPHLSSVVI